MKQRKSQSLAHYLAGGRRAQKLAAPARRSASSTGQSGRLFKADRFVGKARPNRLDFARVFTLLSGKRGEATT